MSELIGAIFLALLTGVCLAAYFTVLHALFPTRTERARQVAETSPARAFFIGLVNFLFFGTVCLVFLALGERTNPIVALPGLVILIAMGIALSLGLSSIAQLTGNRLFPDKSPLARTVWGTGALYFACLTPFVGWFGLTIYVSLLGIGTFILSFFRLKEVISNSAKEI
ncbi:MAG: hypothetical protein Fur0022_09740 [Anaerolineales bacterium]